MKIMQLSCITLLSSKTSSEDTNVKLENRYRPDYNIKNMKLYVLT